MPARASGADGLRHRLLGADGLDDRVRAEPVREVLDAGDALVAAFGDDVGRTEVQGELLPGLVAAHRDDPLGATVLPGRRPSRRAHAGPGCPADPRRLEALLTTAGRTRLIAVEAARLHALFRTRALRQPFEVEDAMGRHAAALLTQLDATLASAQALWTHIDSLAEQHPHTPITGASRA
jgi:hypothetical protein